MKQMNLLRVGVLLVVALFVVGAFTTGGFAKYITGSTGNETARVAQFGVELFAGGDAFATNYAFNGSAPTIISGKEKAVESKLDTSKEPATQDKVVAPGTSSVNPTKFGASGTPEVAINLTMDIGAASDVYLKAGTYVDPTKKVVDEDDKPMGYFILKEDYYPVKVNLVMTKGFNETTGEPEVLATPIPIVTNGTFNGKNDTDTNCIAAALKVGSGSYGPGAVLANEYELTWVWDFEAANEDEKVTFNAADTVLGDLMANSSAELYISYSTDDPEGELEPTTVPSASYSTNVAYDLSVSVEQID